MIPAIPELKWPDLNLIRTTPEEKNKISIFIERAFSCSPNESFLNFSKSEYIVHLPISLCFLYDSEKRVKHVILLLNRTRGRQFSGGTGPRKPKLAYDLLSGLFCVKKDEQNDEGPLIALFIKNPKDNIVPILGCREIKGKHQYFEKAFHGDLRKWIGKKTLQGYHNKILVMCKLLTGLQNLSQYRVRKSFAEMSIEHASFHSDVKIDNILVNDENEVALTDFGFSNMLHKRGFSPFYGHPMKVVMRDWSLTDQIDYQGKFGFKMDLWSLGIVFVVILTNRLFRNGTPPLLFLDDFFLKKKELTQDKITKELRDLRKWTEYYLEHKILNGLWNLVESMLQLKPENIPSVEVLLGQLDVVIRENVPVLAIPRETIMRLDELKKEMQEAMALF